MSILEALFENKDVQEFITENEEFFNEMADLYAEFADIIKQEVMENFEVFIEPNDPEATKENIKVFAENAFAAFAAYLCEAAM